MTEKEERYLVFRSLGTLLLNESDEKIQLSPTLFVTCCRYTRTMSLQRIVTINQTQITVNFYGCGTRIMFAIDTLNTCTTVSDYENGLHRVRGFAGSLFYNSFYLEKEIFSSSTVDTDSKSSIVKFNDSLKIDFNDVPDCLLKYFPTITKSNLRQKGVMFVDLDVEQI